MVIVQDVIMMKAQLLALLIAHKLSFWLKPPCLLQVMSIRWPCQTPVEWNPRADSRLTAEVVLPDFL